MRGHHHVRAGLVQHRAPLRRRRLRAKPQKRQTGGGDNRRADTHGEIDHNRRHRARQDMPEQNGGIRRTDTARRFNKRLVLQHQRIAAHQASKGRDTEYRHGDNDVRHPAAHYRHHGDGEQNAREGEQHVADAHDHAVPPAFVKARQQAQHSTDNRARQHRKHPGGERYPRADNHTAENIAPQRIDTEPVHHRRPFIQAVIIEIVFGVERRNPRREQRQRDKQ